MTDVMEVVLESLIFYVKSSGSGREPYKLTSYGRGADFWIKCSCPAGRNKTLCKHVSFILHGDVTKMVRCEPEDAMSRLHELSAGSDQYAASGAVIDRNLAKERQQAQEARYAELTTIQDVEAAYAGELRGLGWDVRLMPLSHPDRGTGLYLHGSYMRGKNKQVYVNASISLLNIIEEFKADDFDWTSGRLPSDESDVQGEWKPRVKQWSVSGEKVKVSKSFERQTAAITAFLDCARTIPALKV